MGLPATPAPSCRKRRASEATSIWIGRRLFRQWSEVTWPSSGNSMTPERLIVESSYALACSLPPSTVEEVAAAIVTSSEGSLVAEISKRVPHHQHRDMAL